ncbi:hypothetical protein I3843_15G049600 [Carya illinoinensis]|nr:hypothetical protein I3843_15G049600 [Carya illinoinensis]
MVEVILERLRKTWEIWNIRGVILVSLLLQIILFLGAPMRKRTGNRLVILLVWSSYFLAEWAASFALGLITSTQSSKHGENSDLYAFWALFLLLHHGGPGTITAFERNELWLRCLVSLINQVGFTLYVLLQTLPKNNLWLPTSLIFFAGIIKYAERLRSLYLASWVASRVSMLNEPDPRPNYAKLLMGAFSSKKVARLPTTMSQTLDAKIKESKSAFYSSPPRENEKLDGFEVVKYGYHFLNILKGLIVDFVSYEDRYERKVFFYGRSPEDALKVLEVELNFIYEILYTKHFSTSFCWIENVTFDESLLLWHIATELCYHENEVDHDKKAQPDEQERVSHGSQVDHKFISKSLSDYMLYLLVMKPTMMSAVAGIGDIRYRDTCAEAKRFFHNKGLGPKNKEKDACENLLAVNTDVIPINIKGDKSKSVLFDACILAKELQKLEGIEKWEVISKVWVEMLSYASNHCRPDAHVKQASRGGQLISLVWLLMAHFGLVEQYVFTADFRPAN